MRALLLSLATLSAVSTDGYSSAHMEQKKGGDKTRWHKQQLISQPLVAFQNMRNRPAFD